MSANEANPAKHTWFVLLGPLLLAGCSRAPSVDILGSFFPAWLFCLILAVLLATLIRLVMLRLRVNVALPNLAYPSLAALLTFALWLIFFY
jgi:YtcA family